ncbi:hypothetical protein [Nonomuraea sp. CA-141351]|uniref:hypothetical protein n=1 Tax=Nonomuraea sp. CA-141351 TaxID=3239996 RepID=UPI003D89BEE7
MAGLRVKARQALCRSATAGRAAGRQLWPAAKPAHTGPAHLRYDGGDVPERVRRMLQPRPRPALLIISMMGGLLILTLAAANDARQDVAHLLDQVGAMPAHLGLRIPSPSPGAGR